MQPEGQKAGMEKLLIFTGIASILIVFAILGVTLRQAKPSSPTQLQSTSLDNLEVAEIQPVAPPSPDPATTLADPVVIPPLVDPPTVGLLKKGEDPVAPPSPDPATPLSSNLANPVVIPPLIDPPTVGLPKMGDQAVPTENSEPKLLIKDRTNIIIFNASIDRDAPGRLRRALLDINPTLHIAIPKDWTAPWQMQITRIYFCQAGYEAEAANIAQHLPGDQDIIDYQAQIDSGVYFERERKHSRMHDFRPERNLAIFLGGDYKSILDYFKDATPKSTP